MKRKKSEFKVDDILNSMKYNTQILKQKYKKDTLKIKIEELVEQELEGWYHEH